MDARPEWHCRIGKVARKGGATVRVLYQDGPNHEAVEMVEGLLERLKSGDSVAAGFVEVRRHGNVATAYSNVRDYHFLVSGAVRLLWRLAGE